MRPRPPVIEGRIVLPDDRRLASRSSARRPGSRCSGSTASRARGARSRLRRVWGAQRLGIPLMALDRPGVGDSTPHRAGRRGRRTLGRHPLPKGVAYLPRYATSRTRSRSASSPSCSTSPRPIGRASRRSRVRSPAAWIASTGATTRRAASVSSARTSSSSSRSAPIPPGDDLVRRLLRAEHDGDRLAPLEVVAMCAALVFGRHETTVSLIANGVLALLRHPAELARLRADPALAVPAVEELVRWDSPPQFVSRVVAQPCELGGKAASTGRVRAARHRAGQSGPGRLYLARSARSDAHAEPPLGLRARNPFLPGRAALPHEGARRHSRVARALPSSRAGGRAGVAPNLHPAGARAAAGPCRPGRRHLKPGGVVLGMC